MNKTIRIDFNSMKRSKQFYLDTPIVPAKPELTAAGTALTASITTIETIAGVREEGTGTYRGASQQRKFAKSQLLKALSNLSGVAKNLDKIQYPDVEDQLKMREHRQTYQSLLDFARAAKAVVEPIKQVFIDHGSEETVVEDLAAKITALEAAGSRKLTGIGKQIGKTRALTIETRKGMKLVRKLDAIYSQLFENDPALLAEWKSAKRKQRTAEPDPAATQSGASTTPPPAPTGA